MPKPSASLNPRAKVLGRLRQLEALCSAQLESTEHGYFRALGQVLEVLAITIEGTRDPAVLLTVVATVANRSAESMLMHRIEVWRGLVKEMATCLAVAPERGLGCHYVGFDRRRGGTTSAAAGIVSLARRRLVGFADGPGLSSGGLPARNSSGRTPNTDAIRARV